MIRTKTYSPRPADIKRCWYLVDAKNKTLGRLASNAARHLQGKHKAGYAPYMDTGDYVVIINAAQVRVTGNKKEDKMYHRHSGYMGGLKSVSLGKMLSDQPEKVLETAIRGMLPKGPLGRTMYRKLRVYADENHKHSAQPLVPLEIAR